MEANNNEVIILFLDKSKPIRSSKLIIHSKKTNDDPESRFKG